MLSCLLLCLGCTPTPEVRIEYVTVRVGPPANLYSPTLEPVFMGRTCRDLTLYTQEVESALATCNLDKALINKWASSLPVEDVNGTE